MEIGEVKTTEFPRHIHWETSESNSVHVAIYKGMVRAAGGTLFFINRLLTMKKGGVSVLCYIQLAFSILPTHLKEKNSSFRELG